MTELANQSTHASNTCIVANMIELGIQVLEKIDPDLICVEINEMAREGMAEALGAHILNNVVKEIGVL